MPNNSFGGAAPLCQAMTCTRDSALQKTLIVAACLLIMSGCEAFAGVKLAAFSSNPGASATCSGPSGGQVPDECGTDPPVALHEPHYQAGATLTVRGAPVAALGNTSGFVRTGVTVPVDPSSTASLPNEGAIVPTSGTATLREHVSVPIVAGVSIPAKTFGIPNSNLSFEAFAGWEFKNQTFSFNLTEAGLPGTATASSSYNAMDPVVGAGIQYMLGTIGPVPVSLGVHGMYNFPAQLPSLNAASPNFPGTTYTVTGPGRPNLSLQTTLNFDLNTK